MENYGVRLRIQFKYGKIRTRKTPYLDTFSAVTKAVSNLQFHLYQALKQVYPMHMIKQKWSKVKILCYTNASASHKIFLQAINVDLNPRSVAKNHKFSNTIRFNQRQFVCGKCFITSHTICSNKKHLVNYAMACSSSFLHLLLPYCRYDTVDKVEPEL